MARQHILQRGLVLAALLGALLFAKQLGVTDLLAWTERLFPSSLYPALFTGYFGTWLLVVFAPRARRLGLLAGSLACAAIMDAGFLALSIPWIGGLHAVLFSRARRRVMFATAYVVASYVLAAFFIDRNTGYIFGAAYAFRAAWLLHEVHVKRTPALPFADVFLYFVFAPFFVIVPYMLAIPRCDRFRAGLDAHDVAVERSGMKLIAWGLVLAVAHYIVVHTYDARTLGAISAREGAYALALVQGFYSYFVGSLLLGCSMAAIVVGMVRVLGIDLGSSMNAPLAAKSITDWWRRWNTHFRDLLVDLFYYPVVMRLRRRKRLAMVLGCASVFLVGSSLFHWPKHFFRSGSWWPLGAMAENVVMFAMVAIAMLVEAKRPVKRRTVLGVAATLVMVYVAVVVVGYGVAALQFPVPRSSP
jgi:D-alanyl-lipoteichoic acid acyltransferase DltB (MBOAT superfamily)